MKYTKLLALMLACFCCINVNAQMARLYTSESGLANSQINSIYQDSNGFMWISTENGLSRFDGINFSTFRSDRSLPTSIASNMVLTTFEDSHGVFWVGTSTGLQIFNSEYNTFTTVPLVGEAYPESGQHISSITEITISGVKSKIYVVAEKILRNITELTVVACALSAVVLIIGIVVSVVKHTLKCCFKQLSFDDSLNCGISNNSIK